MIDEVVSYRGPYPYVDGLMLRSAGKIINLPVEHRGAPWARAATPCANCWGSGSMALPPFFIKPLRLATAMGGILPQAVFCLLFCDCPQADVRQRY